MSVKALKEKRAAALKAAKALCDSAIGAGRDFTVVERQNVNAFMAEADALQAQIKEAEADEELRHKILELGAGMVQGYPPDPNRAVGNSWGKAFLEGVGLRYGRKTLLPSGSVTVPSLSSTITLLEGAPVPTLLSLIPRRPLEGTDQFSYVREITRTHAAAPTAVGEKKPTSDYDLERVDDNVSTIAHLSPRIPRQTLSDASALRGYIETVMRDGVLQEIEDQIINGDGSGTGEGKQFEGIAETSGINTQTYTTDVLTTTRKAVTVLQELNITPGGWIFTPADWETIELEAAEQYGANRQVSPAVELRTRRLWGYPVALSTKQTTGTGHLVDFAGSTAYWEREDVELSWSENTYDAEAGASDFERNLIVFRAEARGGFAVLRPRGVVAVELSAGT